MLYIHDVFYAIWGLLIGLIFSLVGAAGGLLSSVGFISIIGVQNINNVKLMSQILVLTAALVFIPRYFKERRILVKLGLLLGVGTIAGSYIGSTVSSLYLNDTKYFIHLFGILTLIISLQLLWEVYKAKYKKESKGDNSENVEVSNVILNTSTLSFDYGNNKYKIKIWKPVIAGVVVSFVASIFGVGGGFLLVPILTSIFRLPMHIIPATVAVPIIMGVLVSIGNYTRLGARVEFEYFIPVFIGVIVGAFFGPIINKKLNNKVLKAVLAVIIFLIGINYLIK